MRSLAAVGSNLAAPVQQFQLLLALTLAVLFLGETLTPLNILGIVLVISAPMYILSRRAKEKAAQNPIEKPTEPSGFTPRMAEGYICAFLAGTGFGSSTVLIKAGLSDASLSLIGGVVSYVAATSVVFLLLLVPRMRFEVLCTTRQSAKWFVYSGLGVSISQLFRFLALGLAPVTVGQPLGYFPHDLRLLHQPRKRSLPRLCDRRNLIVVPGRPVAVLVGWRGDRLSGIADVASGYRCLALAINRSLASRLPVVQRNEREILHAN